MRASEGFMREALEQAEEAFRRHEVPVGAVVVREGQVIGRGFNLRESEKTPLSHAELYAIAEAAKTLGDWRLSECDVYVTLEPCPMCLAACQQARVRRVIYGARDPKGGALSLGYLLNSDARLNHRFEVVEEPSPECEQILKRFFSETRLKKK